MTEVIVHVAVSDVRMENRFFETIDLFAKSQSVGEETLVAELPDAPAIMIKTVPGQQVNRKAITFQDRRSAAEFLALWRREQKRV